MAVYIDIDALIDAQLYDDEHEDWNWHRMSVRDYLSLACDVLPTAANVRPVVKGKWIRNGNGTYSCNKCQSWIPEEQWHYANYCLFCGADMRGDADE